MTPDSDLLRQYAENHDEAAFAEIVQRYVNLVYAAALRLLNGDAHLAQDATQAVFTDMGRHAAALIDHATVAGWLHTSARFHASKIARTERRRHAREQKVYAMSNQTTTTEISWDHLAPLLDDALGQLAEADRDALLLRFFQGKSHREVGTILGLDENTARMRVTRVLEKLRDYFARYGVTTTAALLASTLGTQAASVSAPAPFAAALAEKSLASVADAGAVAARTTGWTMKIGVALGVVLIFVLGYSLPVYTKFNRTTAIVGNLPADAVDGQPAPALEKVTATSDPGVIIVNVAGAPEKVSAKAASPAKAGADAVPDAVLTQQSLADAERHTFDITGFALASNGTILRVRNAMLGSNQALYVCLYIWPGSTASGAVTNWQVSELPLKQFSPEGQEFIKQWARNHAFDKAVGQVAPDVQAVLDRFVQTSGPRPIISAGRSLQF